MVDSPLVKSIEKILFNIYVTQYIPETCVHRRTILAVKGGETEFQRGRLGSQLFYDDCELSRSGMGAILKALQTSISACDKNTSVFMD